MKCADIVTHPWHILMILMVLVRLAFLIQQVYYFSSERSQSISLENSGNPLNIMNVLKASLNVCNLSGYLSPPMSGSQRLARAIVSLYYSFNTTYIINLNSIIYWSSPCFKPRSLGPKLPTLPLLYNPLKTSYLFCP